ncbi:MAG TPA: hypothetical protein VFQ59_03720 [Candidatus Paceibacterota bacterium]|nr:hypothetical protein [Candidatus Paceibacterota bacterium]
MNDGKPLDNGEAKMPSIDYYGNCVALVYQEKVNNIFELPIFLHLRSRSGEKMV